MKSRYNDVELKTDGLESVPLTSLGSMLESSPCAFLGFGFKGAGEEPRDAVSPGRKDGGIPRRTSMRFHVVC